MEIDWNLKFELAVLGKGAVSWPCRMSHSPASFKRNNKLNWPILEGPECSLVLNFLSSDSMLFLFVDVCSEFCDDASDLLVIIRCNRWLSCLSEIISERILLTVSFMLSSWWADVRASSRMSVSTMSFSRSCFFNSMIASGAMSSSFSYILSVIMAEISIHGIR